MKYKKIVTIALILAITLVAFFVFFKKTQQSEVSTSEQKTSELKSPEKNQPQLENQLPPLPADNKQAIESEISNIDQELKSIDEAISSTDLSDTELGL